MKDRLPLYPGRVKLVPVSGQENVYDMTRADQPTQAGDPLNKATLLKDATAALFGLGTDAVPDDVLAYLGKYAQYWWRKFNTTPASSEVKDNLDYAITVLNTGSLQYADSYSVSVDGTITLNSPKTIAASTLYENKSDTQYDNKYWSGWDRDINYPLTGIVFIPDTSNIREQSQYDNYYVNSEYYVNYIGVPSDPIPTTYTYVQSSNRSEYPDYGIKGDYWYEYLGIPFDNAATALKIATGSYVGTGKYGQSNPNSLTFEFEPKLVFISSAFNNDGTAGHHYFVNVIGAGFQCGDGNSNTKLTKSGKSISWYNTNSTYQQLNYSGAIYHYVAIG